MKAIPLINGCSKRCPHCKQVLLVEAFGKSANRSDGYNSWCKACHKQYRAKRKGEGLCRSCNNPVCDRSKVYCTAHLERYAGPKSKRIFLTEEEKRQTHKATKQRLATYRRENGLCVKHGEPSRPGYVGCEKCVRSNKERTYDSYYHLKDEVYHAYGGYVCRCCGESNPLFLTLDHIYNDGAKHRREIRNRSTGTWTMYGWLKANNYPSIMQVLCYNCNMGKARNKGICPHKHEYIQKAVA